MAWSRRAEKEFNVDGQLLIELRQDGVVWSEGLGGVVTQEIPISDYLGEEKGRMKMTTVF